MEVAVNDDAREDILWESGDGTVTQWLSRRFPFAWSRAIQLFDPPGRTSAMTVPSLYRPGSLRETAVDAAFR